MIWMFQSFYFRLFTKCNLLLEKSIAFKILGRKTTAQSLCRRSSRYLSRSSLHTVSAAQPEARYLGNYGKVTQARSTRSKAVKLHAERHGEVARSAHGKRKRGEVEKISVRLSCWWLSKWSRQKRLPCFYQCAFGQDQRLKVHLVSLAWSTDETV